MMQKRRHKSVVLLVSWTKYWPCPIGPVMMKRDDGFYLQLRPADFSLSKLFTEDRGYSMRGSQVCCRGTGTIGVIAGGCIEGQCLVSVSCTRHLLIRLNLPQRLLLFFDQVHHRGRDSD